MTSIPKITGVFEVRIGAEVLIYGDVAQIPDTFDNLIRFEPHFPAPPHTQADHEAMAAYPAVLADLMLRERRFASARHNPNR